MNLALEEAQKAFDGGDVPVGAVIVREGMLLGRGYNRVKSLADPTAHAEIIAITAACSKTGEPRLDKADMYVTLEPCAMCAGALILSKISRLFFAGFEEKSGACGSVFDLIREPRLNHSIEVYSGLKQSESVAMLRLFFSKLR